MEFITGLKQQEEAELEDLLKAEEGTTIILEGAVHSVRDMGEIAFVILRKREGLIQTVWEEGKTGGTGQASASRLPSSRLRQNNTSSR